jgi:hypothetical protein
MNLIPLLFAFAFPQSAVYVDDSAIGANDGSSWANAYVDLQAALSATSGGAIWVAEGNYRASAAGNRSASFVLKNGVALHGGFAGWETNLAQRAGSAANTVLDADLSGNDGPAWSNRTENTIHVVSAENVNASAVLDGFRIRGGYATSSSGYDSAGGGMLILNASPTVLNCIVEDCLSSSAGGIYLSGGSPSFDDCEIRGNWGYSANGGGLYQAAGSARLLRCAIRDNRGSNSFQGAGGGLYVSGGSVTVEGCIFERNVANEYYGAFYGAVGGGAFIGADGSSFRDCWFLGNVSHVGGGVTCYGNTSFVNCMFSGNKALTIDTGSGSVGGYGGAIMVWLNDLKLEGCSISGNYATEDCGGVYVDSGSRARIESSILWGNTDLGSTEVLKRNLKEGPGVNADLRWSCIEGLGNGGTVGCTSLDPRFADPNGVDGVLGTADDDLRLRAGSPCIDSGANSGFTGVALDLDGLPRFVDDPSIWDRGSGAAPIADMGAFEFAGHGPILTLSTLQRGQTAALTATGALPFEAVNFFYSFQGPGAGPVYPQYGGMALDLRNPVKALGTVSADAAGTAVLHALLPAHAPLRTVTLQAAIVRGAGGVESMRTNPASGVILP